MEALLPIVNRLQDVFAAVRVKDVELPQLVVVGSQSAGKSSVLENIVGRDFLPRGGGIVTRRPLCLQLVNTHPATGSSLMAAVDGQSQTQAEEVKEQHKQRRQHDRQDQEWGEFLHRPGERFYDFNQIRREILRETERVSGKNKNISSSPISLKISSPYVLDLTMVDLPGITKLPVGDQPSDIEEQVRNIVLQYIENPNALIVAVSSATEDITNSEALKIAREVDPGGNRTLGVVTKLDLMDRGTDALEVLTGKVIQLRLGFVGVVNRSQDDINKAKTIREALSAEQSFFQQHPVYKPLAHRLGTQFLAKRLNGILIRHIRSMLPEVKVRIQKQLSETEDELKGYGEPITEDDHENQGPKLLLTLLSKFTKAFSDALEGKSPDVSLSELYGGARISFIFHEIFSQGVYDVNPFDILSDHDIRTAIRNATGPRPALFVPEVSFELLVKKQIKRLYSPSLQCVDLVFDELQRAAAQCEDIVPELRRFPALRARLVDTVRSLLRKRVAPTKAMISNLIDIELAYINTNHPDFIGGSAAVSSLIDRVQQKGPIGADGGPLAPDESYDSDVTTPNGSTLDTSQVSDWDQQSAAGDKDSLKNKERKSRRREKERRRRESVTPNKDRAGQKGFFGLLFGGPAGGAGPKQHSRASSILSDVSPSSVPAWRRADKDDGKSDRERIREREREREREKERQRAREKERQRAIAEEEWEEDGTDDGVKQSRRDVRRVTEASSPSHVRGLGQQYQVVQQQQQQSDPSMTYANFGAYGSYSYDPLNPKLADVPDTMVAPPPTDRELIETEIIKSLISSYFDIVKKNILDTVPKSIMFFLVNSSKSDLQSSLVQTLYVPEQFPELLTEADDVSEKRKACTELRSILSEALRIVNEVKDSSDFDHSQSLSSFR